MENSTLSYFHFAWLISCIKHVLYYFFLLEILFFLDDVIFRAFDCTCAVECGCDFLSGLFYYQDDFV